MATVAYESLKPLLAAGTQIAATATALFTNGGGSGTPQTEISSIQLFNSSVSLTQVVTLYVGGNTTAYQVISLSLTAGGWIEYAPKVPLILTSGQVLYGIATNASTVNIVITGRSGN